MTDDVAHPFDRLQFEVLWKTDDIFFDIFDRSASLSVYGEASGPEPWQRVAFDAFRAREQDLKPLVYAAIFEYYQSIVEDYRIQFAPDSLHLAPLLESPAELNRVITPEAVHVGDLHPERLEVDLLFHCTWDSGHGLAVRLINGEVAEVGPQDICL